MDCQNFLTENHPIEGLRLNSFTYIDRNCRVESYVSDMATCLAARCESAPDAAYGAEYAESMCKRAGVEVKVELPESYRVAAAEYFESVSATLISFQLTADGPDLKRIHLEEQGVSRIGD